MTSFPAGGLRILFLALDLRLEEDEAESIHVKEVARGIAGLGHHVRLLVSAQSDWAGRGEPSGLSISGVGGGSSLRELARVLQEAKAFRPNVIYERRFLPKVSAAVGMLLRIPSIVEINGLVDEEVSLQGRKLKSFVPSTLRTEVFAGLFSRMSAVVAVTDGLADAMVRTYGVARGRVVVIGNAANTRLFHPMDKEGCRRSLGLAGHRYWICFEGGLYPWHDVPLFLQATRLLVDQGIDLVALIVGDGPSRKEFEAVALKLDLGDRARFIGRVPYERVAEYIGASDVGVGAFTRERNERIGISPIKVFEYVACGRPVVVSCLPGIAEWVDREHVGRLARAGDPDHMARTLRETLEDRVLQADVSKRGPEVVAREHDWMAVATRVAALCGRVA